jgi:Zn-dependent M28 family amino/carboxypeptidase
MGAMLLGARLLLPLLACVATAQAPLPDDRAKGGALLAAAPLADWLGALTSPACGGRATGSAGFAHAAQLVAEHFAGLSLEPLGDDGGYLQAVPWTHTIADPQRSALIVRRGDDEVCVLRPGAGLHGTAAVAASGAGPLTVLVFAPEARDFPPAGVEIGERLVLVVPRGVDVPLTERDGRRIVRRIGSALRAARAAAWLIVDDASCAAIPELAGRTAPGREAGNPALTASGLEPNSLFARTSDLDTILAAAGRARAELDAEPVLALDGLRGELALEMTTGQAPAANVVARLPGGDPRLAAEHVVIGCHLDHLGRVDGVLHPGADDDGSGTVALLAIAQAFAGNGARPARSIVFVAFCGEEVGLIGSDWFTRHPPMPLESIVALLQMDMVGRSEESKRRGETAAQNRNSLHLIGTEKLSPDLHALCVQRNTDHARFALEWDEEEIFPRSDHFNFARQGVPVAFFFTGFHEDYHAPTDTADKIELDKLRRVATYVYDAAFELAAQAARPAIDEARWRRLPQRRRTQPAAPLRK